ncbi:antibiotic biosynthesis monooxygenase [Moniliophthora roreri]|nr:antibiotic biosynthesis monooxygenase [Moniliophthora roreri]
MATVNSLIVTLFNMADSLPANFNGIFNLLVQITAASGKEEELARHLAAVAKSSDSSKEPGTLLYVFVLLVPRLLAEPGPVFTSYHTARGFGADHNKFTIFERYADLKAFEQHRETEAFKALQGSSAMGELNLTFYEDL